MYKNYQTERSARRGTMLVVVLGLLVALFVIGTSFSFITLSERRAAANYLDRQRALDLALDGVEYSIARLRAESTKQHYEAITPGTAGVNEDGNAYDPRQYSLKPLEANDPAVSWAKGTTSSSSQGGNDGLWVDFDGNNAQGGTETGLAQDKSSREFLDTVTGFHADGINVNQIRNENVTRTNEDFGPSGTYEELGDYFRVRVIDAASMINVNNFRTPEHLSEVLLVLGDAIDAWLNNGRPLGKDNPFPPILVTDFVNTAEDLGFAFSSKQELRPIWAQSTNPDWTEGQRDEMYDLAMKFITVNSWVDLKYRDYAEANMQGFEEPENANPLGLEQVRLKREGFTDPGNQAKGADGWPGWKPDASGFGKAPVNINTAPKPVLIALMANIQANARQLFFRQQQDITENNRLYKDKFGVDVPIQNSGTTDFGRQNSRSDTAGIQGENRWHPSNGNNRAIFQLIPIGPISTPFGQRGATTSTGQTSSTDYASALADLIITLRRDHPFTSWQDFDSRFCRGALLQLDDTDRTQIKVPDLVGVPRSTLDRPTGDLANAYPDELLPDPANLQHPANPITSGDSGTAMSGADFRSWYWKSCVDMIRASLCPSNLTARYNEDYPYHMNVDRMDLTRTNAPICFKSMGVFEVVSQGEILAPGDGDEAGAFSSPELRLPIARRKVRTVVQIYEVLRHTSQRDFMSPLDPALILPTTATSSGPQAQVQTMASHTKNHTISGPFSVDELSNGSWDDGGDASAYLGDHQDAGGIGYGSTQPGQPSDQRDRIKGHNEYISADNDFGYVKMNPQDRSPFDEMNFNSSYPLTFHARFNESLHGRTRSGFPQSGPPTIYGVNFKNPSEDEEWGHKPWVEGAMFADFISTATPRSTEPALATGGGANEFQNAASGNEATVYSSLRPDGVYLWGGHLRPGAHEGLYGSYGSRGLSRAPRLKILRYPCGASSKENPFQPIREYAWIGDSEKDDGIDDTVQVGYEPPTGFNEQSARIRLGVAPNSQPPFRGTDQHNENVQTVRQDNSNMPYYEGTVDFWIKWDLPAQGGNSGTTNESVALGEIDTASHNFSGLFGATAYGRFTNSANYDDPSDTNRDLNADFEGVQFFVYKEPGGWLRFTRLYFSEAFGANVQSGATFSTPETVQQFGKALRRIVDDSNPPGSAFSGYTGTSDICNDVGVGNDNLGFLYSRTDAWVDLSNATYQNTNERIVMRPHDWHRFTLTYNSNTNQPYRLWLDGRRVSGVDFADDPDGTLDFRNDGRHAPNTDASVPLESATATQQDEYKIYRTTTKLIEINPEDRLTIGCVFRRQLDLADNTIYSEYFAGDQDQGAVDKPPRPVFKFDSNFVAVANATIDDFRVTNHVIENSRNDISVPEFEAYSRYYGRNAEESYYENGFLPIRAEDGELHALPVRLGTISWTELRPDWDPYLIQGITPSNSSGIEMEWAVFDDYIGAPTGGVDHDFGSGTSASGGLARQTGQSVSGDTYWALGGMSLKGAVLPSGSQVGVFLYRAYFRVGEDIAVNNVTPYLLDVTVTVLTPPRKLSFIIEY